jgi:hypothetical protein
MAIAMQDSRRSACWSLVGLIPCVMATIAESIPAHAPIAGAVRPASELQFDQYGVSYPLVAPTPVIEAHFDFHNRSPAAVTIEGVEPSCGCLRWHLAGARKTFAPGETGSLVVRMHTANERPGPHFYTLDVQIRGMRTHTEQLTFRVTLPERKVSIEPSEVYFYQLNGGADSRTIYVTDHRGGDGPPLEVLRVDSPSEHVAAVAGAPELDPHGRRRIPIVLTVPARLPPGRETTFVRIVTSDADFSQLAFPVLLQGPQEVYGPPIDELALIDVFEVIESYRSASSPPTDATR